MRRTFLFWALSLDETFEEFTNEVQIFIGDTLGRSSGYLSRSGAVDAGKRSGVRFVIVRSAPVVFAASPEVEEAQAILVDRKSTSVPYADDLVREGFGVYSRHSSAFTWERVAVFFSERNAHEYAMDLAESEGVEVEVVPL